MGTRTPEKGLLSSVGRFVRLVKMMENSPGSIAVAATRGRQRPLRGVVSALGLRTSELNEEEETWG